MHYRMYREHKYVSFEFSELERLIAKTNFNDPLAIQKVKQQLSALEELMQGHAEHEDKNIHALLRKKGSSIQNSIEADHKHHHEKFQNLQNKLTEISASNNPEEQITLGYNFYLSYRLFLSDNLRHLHEEETVIMPELQKLCTDAELRSIESGTYAQMTPKDMIHMMQILFPHMNLNDWAFFFNDIKNAEPGKFEEAWLGIAPMFTEEQKKTLLSQLI